MKTKKEKLFEFRAYGKIFKLTAEQCNAAFTLAMSMALLKSTHA